MRPSTRRRGRFFAALTSLAVAAALILASPGSASAQEELILVDYDVEGSTYTAGTGSTIDLGPAVMHSSVASDGTFTGDMALPGTRTEFKLLGFIPVTADVAFEPVEPTTGTIHVADVRYRALTTTSTYYVRLTNLKAVGFPLFAGEHCRTIEPVTIQADTPEGEYFDLGAGGTVKGTYTIGDFQNCGLNTWLINQLVPGSGNTIELQLSNGRIVN